MNWGKSIIAAFVLFALFIGTLVSVCMKEKVSLVSKNYYQEELQYEQRISAMNNYNQLVSKPAMLLSPDTLTVQWAEHLPIEKGTVTFFRPSDGTLDKKFELTANRLLQSFPINNLPKGRYQLRIQWSAQSKDYFQEIPVTL
ncbi:MAG: FixH family protein [Bacteroidota bacterium]